MSKLTCKSRLLGGAVLVALAGLLQAAETLPLVPLQQLQDMKLEYRASKLFITATTNVSLSYPEVSRELDSLIAVEGQQALAPSADRLVKTRIDTSVLGRVTRIDGWLDPDGQALQMSSLRTGKKERYRRYRYLSDAVYSIKRFPRNDKEVAQSWDQWSKTNEDLYPLGISGDTTLTEPEGLFYLLAALDWSRVGERHEILLFDPDGIMRLSLSFLGEARESVEFTEISAQGIMLVDETLSVQQIRINARPFDGEGSAGNFDFLGFKGQVDLYVDPQRRVVVLMRGDIDYLGQIDVRLQKVRAGGGESQ